MKEMKKSIAIFLAAALILLLAVPALRSPFARAESTVTVVFENTVFSKDDGAAWEGNYATEVTLGEEDTLLSIFEKAGVKLGLEVVSSQSTYGSYIDSVGGLSAYDGGSMGGYLFTINDWFPDMGIDSYSLAYGNIKAGDSLALLYSVAWGADIGNDYNNAGDTSLSSLTFGRGSLDKNFDAGKLSYKLTLPKGTKEVNVSAAAKYGSYQLRIYSGSYAPKADDYDAYKDDYYKSGELVPVKDGESIFIGVADSSWPGSVTWVQEDYTDPNSAWVPYAPDSTVYEVSVEISDEPAAVGELEKIYDESAKRLLSVTEPVYGNEWAIITLAKAGLLDDEFADEYLKSVKEALTDIDSDRVKERSSTENSKLVLTLGALGIDPRDIDGKNLLAPLADAEYVSQGGVYGPVYALLAFDSAAYDIPEAEGAVTREGLIDLIAGQALDDGGFAWEGAESGDVDTTAMVIPALAPYAQKNEKAKKALDDALAFLSGIQNADGGYSSFFDGINTESSAVVLIALSTLGRDGGDDADFTKNGYNLLEAVCAFYLGDGVFEHVAGDGGNAYASYQAFQALVSYKLFSEGEKPLFVFDEFKDAENVPENNPEDKPDNKPANDKPEDNVSPATGEYGYTLVSLIMLTSLLGMAFTVRKDERSSR